MWMRRVPRRAFRMVEALDRSYWVYTKALTVNRRAPMLNVFRSPDVRAASLSSAGRLTLSHPYS